MVDARKIMGWVAAPDGTRVVCPRCEGRAFVRLGEVVPWHRALIMVLSQRRLIRTRSVRQDSRGSVHVPAATSNEQT